MDIGTDHHRMDSVQMDDALLGAHMVMLVHVVNQSVSVYMR